MVQYGVILVFLGNNKKYVTNKEPHAVWWLQRSLSGSGP